MIAIFCTYTDTCKCGATGCPAACSTKYTEVYKAPQYTTKPNRKSYDKFIDHRINVKKGK